MALSLPEGLAAVCVCPDLSCLVSGYLLSWWRKGLKEESSCLPLRKAQTRAAAQSLHLRRGRSRGTPACVWTSSALLWGAPTRWLHEDLSESSKPGHPKCPMQGTCLHRDLLPRARDPA